MSLQVDATETGDHVRLIVSGTATAAIKMAAAIEIHRRGDRLTSLAHLACVVRRCGLQIRGSRGVYGRSIGAHRIGTCVHRQDLGEQLSGLGAVQPEEVGADRRAGITKRAQQTVIRRNRASETSAGEIGLYVSSRSCPPEPCGCTGASCSSCAARRLRARCRRVRAATAVAEDNRSLRRTQAVPRYE